MAADLRLVADAADRHADELPAERAAIDWPSEVLPTPGGPTKQRIWPETSFRSFATARYSTIRSFTFSRSKWSLSSTCAGVVEVEVVLGERAPRQRQDPFEVGADDAVLGRGRRQPLEPPELALGGLAHILRQRQLREPLAQLVHLGLLGVALAELLLDRLQLLAQEVLALALLHLRLHLRLDLRAELEDLDLAREDRRDLTQPLLDVDRLEELLALLGRDRAQGRGDEVGERARVVDVRRGELELLGQVGREPDDLREEALDVARQRLDLGRVGVLVREPLELADEIGIVEILLGQADPVQAADEDPQRPVGDLDHLVDHRDRADLVDVVPARRLDRGVARGDEREQAVAGDDVVDQPDRALLADRERRHRLREDDRVLERQHRQRRRQLDLGLGVLGNLEGDVGHPRARP